MALAYLAAGRWVGDGPAFSVVFPYDGTPTAEVTRADFAAMQEAVTCAAAEFARNDFAPARRAGVLRRAALLLAERAEDFAQTIVAEAGKTIRDARVEVKRAAGTLRLSAEEAERLGGEVVALEHAAAGRFGVVRRFPVGPVLAITPFNFPLNLVCHKLGPAVAVGAPVVLKPSRKTPVSALKLARLLIEAGLPERFLSVVPGSAEDADALARDARLAVLTFTGSAGVGWALKAASPARRVLLELGGNAACIVCADADLKRAVSRCVVAAFANAGQVCISLQRILVERPAYEEFLDEFCRKARKLRVGDPREEATDVGPMVESAAAERAAGWVEEALEGGATAYLPLEVSGTLFSPCVLGGVDERMRVWSEEVFAPVVCVEPFDDFAEAVRRADDGRYGLQAGLFTQNLRRVMYAYEKMRVGALLVNEVPTWRADAMPYGGAKDSGLGREGPRYVVEEMTEPRMLVLG